MDPSANNPASPAISPSDFDLMVRTVIGEAGNDPSAPGVAHVILNRLNSGNFGGNTVPQVVLAKGQFEPWATRGRELSNIPVNSQPYQDAAKVVSDAVSGRSPDPTGGATHFLNPSIVMQRRGGSLPSWAQAPIATIGNHSFYAPQGKVVDPMDAINKAISDN